MVANGKTLEALDFLLSLTDELNKEAQNEIIILRSKFRKISSDINKGLLDYSESQREIAKINSALLNFLDSLSKRQKNKDQNLQSLPTYISFLEKIKADNMKLIKQINGLIFLCLTLTIPIAINPKWIFNGTANSVNDYVRISFTVFSFVFPILLYAYKMKIKEKIFGISTLSEMIKNNQFDKPRSIVLEERVLNLIMSKI